MVRKNMISVNKLNEMLNGKELVSECDNTMCGPMTDPGFYADAAYEIFAKGVDEYTSEPGHWCSVFDEGQEQYFTNVEYNEREVTVDGHGWMTGVADGKEFVLTFKLCPSLVFFDLEEDEVSEMSFAEYISYIDENDLEVLLVMECDLYM